MICLLDEKSVKKYKTSLCNYWVENGYCHFGEYCTYAHGEQELRYFQRNSNYKTRCCNNFFGEKGFCPYGQKCIFLHTPIVSKRLSIFEEITEQIREQITEQIREQKN